MKSGWRDARIIELEGALRAILKVDWERGVDWDTNTIMHSYLDAANRMQEIARTALDVKSSD